ncbi:hypothetical protein [Rhodococcus yananensis]|uniref:hypothetical protein n=1 Tax=Rhodococcus yananensis TaxID=2879464 RepID=UPI001CF92160|nr:hypothetical protein [Rhodococcus yananensis]
MGDGDRRRRLAAAVDGLDPVAGRAVHDAIARAEGPVRVQIAGRAGTGRSTVREHLQVSVREHLEVSVRESLLSSAGVHLSVVTVDAPDVPDPVLDADVVVYVLPTRPDASSVHPADRAAVVAANPGCIVAVVAGGGARPDLGPTLPVHALDDPRFDAAVAECIAGAHRRRLDVFARTLAEIPASPAARDVLEAALDDAPTGTSGVHP